MRLDFPVGELRVEATSGESVTVELTARCKWGRNCEDSLEDVRIESSSSKSRLDVDIDAPRPWGKLKLELKATIQVPRGASLTIDMGIGELRVEGFENDLRIDLGIGEVSVRLPEAAIETLSVDAGIGDASVHGSSHHVSGRRSKLIGSEVYWDDGAGESRVTVEVGIGEAPAVSSDSISRANSSEVICCPAASSPSALPRRGRRSRIPLASRSRRCSGEYCGASPTSGATTTATCAYRRMRSR